MTIHRLSAFVVVLALLAACTLTLGQPRAPAVREIPPIIMDVKYTEPLTVLETTLRAPRADPGPAITEAGERVWGAAVAARLNVLPNHGIVAVLTPMEDLQQGALEELDFAVQLPVIDDLEPGPLAGEPGIEVVRTEVELVAYTYSRGPPEVAIEQGWSSLFTWVGRQGFTPVGPLYTLHYQNVPETDPWALVWELRVVLEVPAGEAE